MANPDVEKRIQNFPLRTMKVRGVSFLVRVDPETNLGYIMEENGTTWTGKKAKVGKPPEKQTVREDEGHTTQNDPKGERETEKKKWWEKKPKAGQAPKTGKMKKDKSAGYDSNGDDQEAKRKKALIFVAIAAVALVVVSLLATSGIFSRSSNNGSTQNTDEPLETENIAMLAAAENYEVLIVTRNMFPGDIIEESDLASFVISKVEYAQCGGAYPSSCKGNVVGMQMKKFLPFGALLDYDSCTTGSDYTVAPWDMLNDNQVYVDMFRIAKTIF